MNEMLFNASFVCGYVKIHYVCVCEHLVAFSCFVRIFFFLSRESGSLTKILLHMNFTQIMGPVCVWYYEKNLDKYMCFVIDKNLCFHSHIYIFSFFLSI